MCDAFNRCFGEVEAGQNLLVKPCIKKKKKVQSLGLWCFKSEGCVLFQIGVFSTANCFLLKSSFPVCLWHLLSVCLSLSPSYRHLSADHC